MKAGVEIVRPYRGRHRSANGCVCHCARGMAHEDFTPRGALDNSGGRRVLERRISQFGAMCQTLRRHRDIVSSRRMTAWAIPVANGVTSGCRSFGWGEVAPSNSIVNCSMLRQALEVLKSDTRIGPPVSHSTRSLWLFLGRRQLRARPTRKTATMASPSP